MRITNLQSNCSADASVATYLHALDQGAHDTLCMIYDALTSANTFIQTASIGNAK